MKISNIEITTIRRKGGHFGFCSLILEDVYWIGGIALFTRPGGGIRCVFPTRVAGEREFPLHHPISRETGVLIEEAVSRKVDALSLLDS